MGKFTTMLLLKSTHKRLLNQSREKSNCVTVNEAKVAFAYRGVFMGKCFVFSSKLNRCV